jgi:hypothetical protein
MADFATKGEEFRRQARQGCRGRERVRLLGVVRACLHLSAARGAGVAAQAEKKLKAFGFFGNKVEAGGLLGGDGRTKGDWEGLQGRGEGVCFNLEGSARTHSSPMRTHDARTSCMQGGWRGGGRG